VRFHPLHAANPNYMTGSGNWTYLIPGQAPLLVDAGVGRSEHLDAIAAASPDGPQRVLVTHAHSDHVKGVTAIAERWPLTRFFKYPWPARDALYPVKWEFVADGDRMTTDEGELELLLTPGHAPDHLAVWHGASRTVFTADLLVKGTTVVIPGSFGGDLVAYLRSLERIRSLEPARVLPAHGDVIEGEEIAALIRYYVDHRVQREAQVLTALEQGPATTETVVAGIYPGLSDELTNMARESVLAHLKKLEQEGRAQRENDRWLLAAR
jgi:glyoxylase-like metal-dependent hydrolase (beta-lactamase superfamily II)